MKAILIDPVEKRVNEVEVGPPGKLETLHEVYEAMDCEYVQPIYLDHHNVMFIDENALMKKDPGPFFGWDKYPQPLAGKCLVLGYDADSGDEGDVNMTRGEVEQKVTWLNVEFLGYQEIEPHTTKDGLFVVGKKAVFRQLGKPN